MGETGKRLLSIGCLGCFGLLVAVIVAGAIVWHSTPPLEMTKSSLQREIPPRQVEVEPDLASPSGKQGLEPSTARPVGRVVLDLRDASATVLVGTPGDPIKASARYDRESCRLEESFLPAGGAGEPWQYTVTFRRERHPSLTMALKEIFGGASPEVTITLPPDVPLAVVGEVKRGGARLTLDDLWLTEVDLDVDMGGLEVAASRPTRAPMERLRARVSMGGSELTGVAWASPAVLDLDYRMGGMELDLGGDWVRDSDIRITGRMGGAEVRLPDNVRLVGVPQRKLRLDAPQELPPPTLRFEIDCDQGGIDFKS